MRREERVTVQGPVNEQQPDGMSHRGADRPHAPKRSARGRAGSLDLHATSYFCHRDGGVQRSKKWWILGISLGPPHLFPTPPQLRAPFFLHMSAQGAEKTKFAHSKRGTLFFFTLCVHTENVQNEAFKYD